MKSGKAFEIFVKRILINVGFSGVQSDNLYVFNGAPGQMIQGLGEAHNADVLLAPPVQTPFYVPTRLLIECKDYSKKIGLNTVRSALGLREDINHFDIVDIDDLRARRSQKRSGAVYNYERYSYQVAIAAMNGYTVPAQKFAATHRIPLIGFQEMPFWDSFRKIIMDTSIHKTQILDSSNLAQDDEIKEKIINLADKVGRRMAVAITNSGQMLFLYCITGDRHEFGDDYSLHWTTPNLPWELRTDGQRYQFQLPQDIMKSWLRTAVNDLEMKKEAINCKITFMSNMIVYYTEGGKSVVKMISIDKNRLKEAKKNFS